MFPALGKDAPEGGPPAGIRRLRPGVEPSAQPARAEKNARYLQGSIPVGLWPGIKSSKEPFIGASWRRAAHLPGSSWRPQATPRSPAREELENPIWESSARRPA